MNESSKLLFPTWQKNCVILRIKYIQHKTATSKQVISMFEGCTIWPQSPGKENPSFNVVQWSFEVFWCGDLGNCLDVWQNKSLCFFYMPCMTSFTEFYNLSHFICYMVIMYSPKWIPFFQIFQGLPCIMSKFNSLIKSN